jgi:hypothetical protein
VNRRDRYAVITGPVPRCVLQIARRVTQGFGPAGFDPKEQAELARRANLEARVKRCRIRS